MLYSELEVERLRILFELIDVDAILEDPSITEWMEAKGIKRKNEQMGAIFGILKKRQGELEAMGSLREPVDSAKPSRELLESRLVKEPYRRKQTQGAAA